MKTHSLIQGSPEWLAYRAQRFNASDAPAMMGCSPYKARAALLRELHTGLAADVDVATQKRFDNGHRVEALARPLAEDIIGQVLYQVTGSLGKLSASFDGLTLDESEGFEHKALNDALRAAFDAMTADPMFDANEDCRRLPIYHRVQMEQQLHVSGADRILFMASAWDAEGNLIEERHCWYYPDEELRADILRGWVQFEADLAAYTPPPATEAAPVGKAPDSLPALRIEVTGQVTASNLAEFKETALTAIRSVNRSLKTDKDFADARKAIKWCEDIETKVKAAKQAMLAQTVTIDEAFRVLDEIAAESKDVRIDLTNLDKRRSLEVKEEAVAAARKAFDLHVAVINSEIAPVALRAVQVDFAGAIKGLRSISSMQDALDTALAGAKIAADTQGRAIRANVAAFNALALADDYGFLFADLHQLVHKAADDFGAVVRARIAEHKQAEAAKEAKRKADEAARIAQAEQRAREQEAARIEAAQAESARLEALAVSNRARLASEDQAKAGAAAALYATQSAPSTDVRACRPEDRAMLATPAGADLVAKAAAALRADEPATLNLGAICSRLGFTVSAAFLADVLHVQAAKQDKAAQLYTETQFGLICRQIGSHVGAMAELYAGETA